MATYYNNDRTKYSAKSLILLLSSVGFSGADLRSAYAIVMRESGGYPNAFLRNTNGTLDRGLFQINDVNHSFLGIPYGMGTLLYDPVFNVKKGKKLFDRYNWSPWAVPNSDGSIKGYALHLKNKAPTTYRLYNERYQKYLNQYDAIVGNDPVLESEVQNIEEEVKLKNRNNGLLKMGLGLLTLGLVFKSSSKKDKSNPKPISGDLNNSNPIIVLLP